MTYFKAHTAFVDHRRFIKVEDSFTQIESGGGPITSSIRVCLVVQWRRTSISLPPIYTVRFVPVPIYWTTRLREFHNIYANVSIRYIAARLSYVIYRLPMQMNVLQGNTRIRVRIIIITFRAPTKDFILVFPPGTRVKRIQRDTSNVNDPPTRRRRFIVIFPRDFFFVFSHILLRS